RDHKGACVATHRDEVAVYENGGGVEGHTLAFPTRDIEALPVDDFTGVRFCAGGDPVLAHPVEQARVLDRNGHVAFCLGAFPEKCFAAAVPFSAAAKDCPESSRKSAKDRNPVFAEGEGAAREIPSHRTF